MPTSAPTMPAAPLQLSTPTYASERRSLYSLLPLLVVFYSILLFSPEVEFVIFGVRFTAYRFAVLFMTVPALWMTMRNTKGVVGMIDVCIIIATFWIMLSFMTIYGFEAGFVRGLGIVIDTGLSYFVARACIRTPDDIRHVLLLILPGLIFAGGLLVLESVSGRILYRPFMAGIFGNMTKFAGGEEVGRVVLESEFRIGLLRAYGPFIHPILAGAVMIGFLPLYYFSGLRGWPFFLGVALAFSGFFSLSSAAFLALILSIGAILIHHVKPYFVKLSWWTIVSLFAVLVWAVHMTAQNGIIPVIARLTLTPATADYRRLIWEYGSISVAKNPWFGIGYKQWDRLYWMTGDSVDAHFLLLAMRHGLLVAVVLFVAIIYGMIRLGMIIPSMPTKERLMMIGMNITMLVYVIVGQTVNYFGSAGLVFMSMVAFLASMLAWSEQQVRNQRQISLMQLRRSLHMVNAQRSASPAGTPST